MSELTQSITQLVDEFAKLPGIGKKSAERLTYHILRIHRKEALALADAIRNVKDNVQYCSKCYNLAEGEECAICRDPSRQRDVLCVVEQPRDLMALEQSGVYRGLYHVLLGRIAPLDGIGPEQLTIDALGPAGPRGRLQGIDYGDKSDSGRRWHGACIFRTCSAGLPIKITRLARGITTGSVLEFANKEILADALTGRQQF